METDRYYFFDDYEEAERIDFIASEIEWLRNMAKLYADDEYTANLFDE